MLLEKVRDQSQDKIGKAFFDSHIKTLQDRLKVQIETAVNESEFAKRTMELNKEF